MIPTVHFQKMHNPLNANCSVLVFFRYPYDNNHQLVQGLQKMPVSANTVFIKLVSKRKVALEGHEIIWRISLGSI